MKVGDTVKWAQPHSDAESRERMVILEDNGDRLLLQEHIQGWRIQPTRVVAKEWVEVAFPHSETMHGPVTLWGYTFEECGTGGGCVALRAVIDGVEVLITGYNEGYLPTRTDWNIGFYTLDGHQFRLAAGDGTNEVVS